MQTTRHIFQDTGTTPALTRNSMDAVLSNPEHIFAVLDVTQSRIGEKPTSTTALKFRSACNRAPFGMLIVRAGDGKVLLSNPAMQQLLGYTAKELVEMTFTQFTHPDDVESQKRAYSVVKSGQRVSFDMKKRYLRKDGTSFATHLVSTAIRRSSNKPVVMIEMIMETIR